MRNDMSSYSPADFQIEDRSVDILGDTGAFLLGAAPGVVARLFRGEGFPPRVKKGPASKDAGYSKPGAVPGISTEPSKI